MRMFNTAIEWLDAETDDTQRRLLVNLIAACGFMYEKAYRGNTDGVHITLTGVYLTPRVMSGSAARHRDSVQT